MKGGNFPPFLFFSPNYCKIAPRRDSDNKSPTIVQSPHGAIQAERFKDNTNNMDNKSPSMIVKSRHGAIQQTTNLLNA